MSNKILDLDDGAGKVYSTNYSGFLEEKQRDLEKQMADFKDQQALIKKQCHGYHFPDKIEKHL